MLRCLALKDGASSNVTTTVASHQEQVTRHPSTDYANNTHSKYPGSVSSSSPLQSGRELRSTHHKRSHRFSFFSSSSSTSSSKHWPGSWGGSWKTQGRKRPSLSPSHSPSVTVVPPSMCPREPLCLPACLRPLPPAAPASPDTRSQAGGHSGSQSRK